MIWCNRVVPVAVERVVGEIDSGQLSIRNLEPFGIFVLVQLDAHFSAALPPAPAVLGHAGL